MSSERRLAEHKPSVGVAENRDQEGCEGGKLSSKHTPDARKTRFSLFGFNLTQARAADDELWCVYDPVFDLFLPCEPAA